MNNNNKISCIVDGLHGIHIPEIFINNYSDNCWKGITDEQKETIKDIDNIEYWEAWEEVLKEAYHVDSNGFKWSLYHNEDLFMVRSDYEFEDNF